MAQDRLHKLARGRVYSAINIAQLDAFGELASE